MHTSAGRAALRPVVVAPSNFIVIVAECDPANNGRPEAAAAVTGSWRPVQYGPMDLSLATSYDASPEEVFAMITDVTFQEQVFERLRVPSYDVVVGGADDLGAGDDLAVRFHWQTKPSDVPVVARRFVGHTLELAQNKVWHRADVDGAREADVDGEVTGVPVKVTGTTRIVPAGRGTTQAFDLRVTASVPMVGRGLEQVVADAVRVRLEKKFEVAWSWLAGSL